MRQSVVGIVTLLVVALFGVATARPRSRRFVAVPLEHVQLVREVRRAPPPPPPPPPPPSSHDYYDNRRYHRPAPEADDGDEPQPQATSLQVAAAPDATAYDVDSFAPEPDQARNRYERQSGGGGGGGDDHEYVDYGAHTGHHGAFGWYADFPVVSKGHRR